MSVHTENRHGSSRLVILSPETTHDFWILLGAPAPQILDFTGSARLGRLRTLDPSTSATPVALGCSSAMTLPSCHHHRSQFVPGS